ncbi:type I polyketide synthase [Motilimonas pumila]|uniref:SDR family NAD(P)-dependent oxidoreductase n=1 Tax=Motilimonas pumila TaxID=2303987 RepID=A0A418YB13_9GAMM|nr:type I polyketide synthase [Motilimonas pumila]RJG40164.1 SDR family NAD(P)-dependent oxidoreductase [Motilimonas pumila]
MSDKPDQSKPDIAIVGMASLFAESNNLDAYWELIRNKVDAIIDVPASRWHLDDYFDEDKSAADKVYCRRGGFIPDIDFDPMAFGLPPNILELTDTSQLLSLVVAQDALQDAGLSDASAEQRNRIGVVLGVGGGQKINHSLNARLHYPVLKKVLLNSGVPAGDADMIVEKFKSQYVHWEENSFPGSLGNVIAGRIANRFDLGGMNCVVDAACAGSLAATKMALSELWEGRADVMLTGGVCTDNSPQMYMSFSKTPAFTDNHVIQPFDKDSKGMMIGEGIGMVALKRLADAERDGDRIYAVVKGVGTSSDGKFKSIYAPRPEGQAKALNRAYQDAGFAPHTVGLVEAHGTGTAAGDVAEFEGLKQVFALDNPQKQHIALGSVKSQIGHTKSTAGTAGFIKAALALHHKVLPPTINVNEPNPKMAIADSPFYINTETRPWISQGVPRRAGISSFGFGGTNYHVVLEEYQGESAQAYRFNANAAPILMAAETPEQLLQLCQTWQQELVSDEDFRRFRGQYKVQPLTPESARLGFVAETSAAAKSLLTEAVNQLQQNSTSAWQNAGVSFQPQAINTNGKVAALFAGQGSQYVNMGLELANAYPVMREHVARLDELLGQQGQTPLSQVLYPIPAFTQAQRKEQQQAMQNTRYAQPAIGAFSLSSYQLMQQAGLQADFFAGHSFGELTALAAAELIDDAAYLNLCVQRGCAMADVPAGQDCGAMMAVVLNDKSQREGLMTLLEQQANAWLANDNSPTQLVLAGTADSLASLANALKAQGIKTVHLPVSAAFHTPLVEFAQLPFAKAIEATKFKANKQQVFSNITAQPYGKTAKSVKQSFQQHMLSEVKFADQLENMYQAGARVFVEFGPKSILSRLIKDTLKYQDVVTVAVNGNAKQDSDSQLKQALIELAVLGIELSDFDRYQLAAKPVKAKGSPLTISLGGQNYLSPATKDKMQQALQQGHVTVSEPQIIEKEIIKEVVKHVPVTATHNDSTPLSEPQAMSQHAPSAVNPPSELAQLLQQQQTALAQSMAMFQQQQNQSIELQQNFIQQNAQLSQQLLQLMAGQTPTANIAPATAVQSQVQPGLQPSPQAPSQMAQPQPQASLAPSTRAEEPLVANESPMASTASNTFDATSIDYPSVNDTAEQALASASTAANSALSSEQVQQVMLSVVAEKTGYPAEMLELGMDLEADLGIDSIKRVEILGTVQDNLPQLPALNPEDLAELRTLAEIVAYMQSQLSPASQPQAEAAVNAATATASVSVQSVMMSVVADKTGYPSEMLELSMDLEADLGIDSIKRVEILGTVQDQLPQLPALNPEDLAELRTLGEIVDYINQQDGQLAASALPQQAQAANVEQSAQQVQQVMLQVVADKTGYPAEMLELTMDLEADLGIDSIKRVEILGTVQDQLPALPALNPEDLAELRTLGEIVQYMNAQFSQDAAPSVASSATENSGGLTPAQVQQAMLEVVADKTGYPTEMLELTMDLEADLGIDSIKRVEILGTVQDQLPALPALNPEDLAELRTLAEIVQYMNAQLPQSNDVASTQSEAVINTQTLVPAAAEIQQAMLSVVADKTGYPAEMLELTMDLEADLGIDSIKRVEILGTVQDTLPSLPALNPEDLAELRTLGEIIHYMEAQLAANSNAASGVDNSNIAPASGQEGTDVPFQYALMRPLAPLRGGQAYQGQVIIFDDGRCGGLVAEKLLQQGLQPELVVLPDHICAASTVSSDITRHILVDDNEASIAEFCQHWLATNVEPLAFVQLFDSELPASALLQVTAMALLFAKHLQPRLSQAGSRYLSAGELDGGFGLRQGLSQGLQYSAAFAGLTKTLAQEWPEAVCRALDIAGSDKPSFAQTVVAELLAPQQEAAEVAYHQGERMAIVAQASHESSDHTLSHFPLSCQDVVLVSGGAKGVTNACVAELAAHSKASFILLGRSAAVAIPSWAQGLNDKASLQSAALAYCQQQGEKPTPASLSKMIAPILSQLEINQGIEAITEAGGRAHYAAVDVTDEAALTELVASVQQTQGAITALVHGAGVLADGLIENKQLEDYQRVFATKVSGLQALLHATKDCQLSHIAVFSSAAGFYGNKGQSDYAMANEVLNKTAITLGQDRPQCRVLSFNWGPWDGGMVTPELKRMFEQRGVYVIPVTGGAQLFRQQMLAGDAKQVQVIVGTDMAGQTSQAEEIAKVKKSLAQRLNKTLNLAENGFLQLHRIAGNAVLPTVVATAWMRQGITQLLPAASCQQVVDYQLYKGIVFTPEADSVRLTLAFEVLSQGGTHWQIKARISSQENNRERLHYGAVLHVRVPVNTAAANTANQYAEMAEIVQDGESEAQVTAWLAQGQPSTCYQDGSLFHQGEFCLLQQDLCCDQDVLIQSMSVANLSADFFGQFSQDMTATSASVLAEDAMYQSLLVWVYRQLGKQSLPAGCGEILYAPQAKDVVGLTDYVASGAECVLVTRIKQHNQFEVIADIRLLTPKGQALLVMKHAKVVLMQDQISQPKAKQTVVKV